MSTKAAWDLDAAPAFWDQPRSRGQTVRVLVVLGFILFPMVDAATSTGNVGRRAVMFVCAAAFIANYVAMLAAFRKRRFPRWSLLSMGAMFAFASLLTLVFQSGWAYLFCYSAGCSSLLATDALMLGCVLASAGLSALTCGLAGGTAGSMIGFAASAAGVGLMMTLVRDLRMRNQELSAARAELAELAVAAERERFARDLHDLLGHSLSVIALKAELAGRLLPAEPERSAQEVSEIKSVARGALTEVREAVSGYRKPTLDSELKGARVALSAAGVECQIDRGSLAVGPESEAVLAWAIREGATNVIRHSGAEHCTVRVLSDPAGAAVEVLDDGRGCAAMSASDSGNGLAGLRERVFALAGTMAAGPLDGGGYRLAVTVPAAPAEV